MSATPIRWRGVALGSHPDGTITVMWLQPRRAEPENVKRSSIERDPHISGLCEVKICPICPRMRRKVYGSIRYTPDDGSR